MNDSGDTSARWRRMCATCVAVLSIAAMAVACGKGAGENTTTATPPAAIAVKVDAVAPRSVPVAFDVVGQTEGSKQVEVRARVSGILEKRLYHEGDAVQAAAPLFQIDRSSFELALAQANAALAQERAKLAQTTRDEARYRDLVADRAVSQKDYDDALSARPVSTRPSSIFRTPW